MTLHVGNYGITGRDMLTKKASKSKKNVCLSFKAGSTGPTGSAVWRAVLAEAGAEEAGVQWEQQKRIRYALHDAC
jgi:hypothetical protein